MDSESNVRSLVEIVLSKPKYRSIHPGLIASLIRDELSKQRSEKEVIKEVTGRLHQVGGAYFKKKPDYTGWGQRLEQLPRNIHSDDTRDFCIEIMGSHSSTSERLGILKEFFMVTLESISPVESIIDLACGLNPLAFSWMPVTRDAGYYGCDIFSDMTNFLNSFYEEMGLIGHFSSCDLMEMQFMYKAKVAFLLKTLPCLEQITKGVGVDLLQSIPADHLLISYPVRSLGGRTKGMGKTYETLFNEMAALKGWKFERFEFPSELAFLVTK